MKLLKALFFITLISQVSHAQGIDWDHEFGRRDNLSQRGWLQNEQVKHKVLNLHQRGRGQIIKVRRQLGINRMYRGEIVKSIIIIAKTRRGAGNMSVLVNGSPISYDTVGTSLQSYEISINAAIGRGGRRGLRSLQIETNGNFLVQSIMVVLSRGLSQDRDNPAYLSVSATVNQMIFDLEGPSEENIRRQCLRKLRLKRQQRPNLRIRRVVANGVIMRRTPGVVITPRAACDFIARQAETIY